MMSFAYTDVSGFWTGLIAGAAVAGFLGWSITYWWAHLDPEDYRDEDWWWKALDYPPDDLEPRERGVRL